MTRIRAAVRTVRRFVRRTPVERRLLVRSFLLLLALTVGLRLMPLVSLQRVIRRVVPNGRGQRDDRPSPETLAWAVTAGSSYVPGATCLVRALALQALLEAYGWPARLCIGFGRGDGGTLAGHAWIEEPDGRVIGDEVPIAYTPLPLPGVNSNDT